MAAERNYDQIVTIFLNAGAYMEYKDEDKETALMKAYNNHCYSLG